MEVTSGSNIGAAEYVFQTRRLAEVLRVMQSDGNTVEEIERVRNELRGRYAEIEKWPDARLFRNKTATVEEREQSLKAAREAKANVRKGMNL